MQRTLPRLSATPHPPVLKTFISTHIALAIEPLVFPRHGHFLGWGYRSLCPAQQMSVRRSNDTGTPDQKAIAHTLALQQPKILSGFSALGMRQTQETHALADKGARRTIRHTD